MAEENVKQDQSKAVEDAIREAEEAAAKAHADDEAESVNADDVKETQAPQTDADAAAEAIDDGADKEEKKGFFGKKKENKELTALKEQVAEFDDRFKRQMAEFENFRKRSDKEKEQMFSLGEKNVLEKFLPVIDNFERGFDTVAEEDKEDAFVLGMHKVYDQLIAQLGSIGVKPIDAVGQDFDPEFHNAVMQVDSEELESGKVAQELQKGYMYHDTVLRHSMVSVVK